jgi:hypothetical protein
MVKDTPYAKVESWLVSFAEWKSEIKSLKSQLSHVPGLAQRFELVAIHGKGQKNEAILNEVIRRSQIMEHKLPFLELRVHLIEISFSALTPEEREFVELKYMDKLANSLAMDRLGLSPRVFYRRRIKILDKIYKALGGSETLEWFQLTEKG